VPKRYLPPLPLTYVVPRRLDREAEEEPAERSREVPRLPPSLPLALGVENLRGRVRGYAFHEDPICKITPRMAMLSPLPTDEKSAGA